MFRWIILLCITLTAMGAALIGVVRAQPLDESAVRAVFDAPPDCPAPCWQGIRVGMTSADEAYSLLFAHDWITDLYRDDQRIVWRWSGAQPTLIDASSYGLISVERGTVIQLRVQTHARFGDVWITYAAPNDALLVRPLRAAYQIVRYDSLEAQVISTLDCPAYPRDLWYSTTSLGLGELWITEELNAAAFDVYEDAGWWRYLHVCRPPRARGR